MYSLGVETLWNFMREMNVAPDAELEDKVCVYIDHAMSTYIYIYRTSHLVS